jgi:hypothetical protein
MAPEKAEPIKASELEKGISREHEDRRSRRKIQKAGFSRFSMLPPRFLCQ